MHIGTALTVVCLAAVIAAVIGAVVQNGGAQETRELVLESRDMSTPSQEGIDLRRQGQFYLETFQILMMDSELDAGECNTLSDLAEPLAGRIADSSSTEPDYAERLSRMIDSVEEICQ